MPPKSSKLRWALAAALAAASITACILFATAESAESQRNWLVVFVLTVVLYVAFRLMMMLRDRAR